MNSVFFFSVLPEFRDFLWGGAVIDSRRRRRKWRQCDGLGVDVRFASVFWRKV